VNVRLSARASVNRGVIRNDCIHCDEAPTEIHAEYSIFATKRYRTPVYQRDDLLPGQHFDGPAIIVELTATSVVPPGWQVMIDDRKYLVGTKIKREEGS
jgi:N-methylhydantoinase A